MEQTGGKIGKYRWVICALLFFATTINYMDRQVIAILKPVLQTELHWENPNNIEQEYSYIVMAFTLAYAFGVLVFGWFIDKVGT
ncbi:MAG: MFS transporter [Bacteroidota bacterium]